MNEQSLKGPLGVSVLSIVVIVIFVCITVSTMINPFLHKSTTVVASQTDSLIDEHRTLIAADIARFNGRSAFFKPIPIPRKTQPIVGPVIVTPPMPPAPIPTGPPPPPASYMGPPLIAIIGEEAWFRGSGSGSNAVIRLKTGEEADGLKLISTAMPSSVTVQYRRGEYTIDLFTYEEPFLVDEAHPIQEPDFLEEVDASDADTVQS